MRGNKKYGRELRVKPAMTGCVLLLLMLCSCQQRMLSDDDPCDNMAPVDVIIHWEGIEPQEQPQKGMAVHLFPWDDGGGQYLRENLPVSGGRLMVPIDIPYFVLCYDYYGNDYINFRNDDNRDAFEAYSVFATGTYNSYGPGRATTRSEADNEPLTEQTVAEPYPYNFYVARNDEPFAVHAAATTDNAAAEIHCYPHNVLHEFTFIITDVIGIQNIAAAHGAISGMSSTYRISDGQAGTEPMTVLFGNQSGRVQWTGNAVIGRFCTFGPADILNIRNQLTVEVLSIDKGYYYAVWGGKWEDTVREQIAGALGQNGTREEQLAWRAQNGGYDIVLPNDERLVIPDPEPINPGGDDGGGFIIDVGMFNNLNIPMTIK